MSDFTLTTIVESDGILPIALASRTFTLRRVTDANHACPLRLDISPEGSVKLGGGADSEPDGRRVFHT